MASYTVPHDPKMVHEAMCLAEGVISRQDVGVGRDVRYLQIISDFIKECERKRPLGPNGKHGNMHTAECGCEDVKWISVSNDNINHPFKAGGQAKTDILVDSHVFWPRDDDPDICKADRKSVV